MPAEAPRLLLAVAERPGLREAVSEALPGVPFAFLSDLNPPEAPSVEAALLGSISREASNFDASRFPALRFVQRMFAGVDDVPFARLPSWIDVAGNVGGYSPFVAEHAVALALASARFILEGSAAVAEGRSRPAPELRTLYRETVVILGYGAIGSAIADRLRPFEVEVRGLNRHGDPVPGVAMMFSADRLREAVAGAGYIFDVRPLTDRTRASLGAAELQAMRDDATFVNVGRGGTVDEEALYRHLVAHPRFRAALDVWWDEDFAHGRLRTRFPFATLPNFLGTPHWAGYSPRVEAYARGTALANLARFFRGERPRHIVDRAEYLGRPAPSG